MSIADRLPRPWTLWKAARPSQILLILLVYALGIGIGVATSSFPGPEEFRTRSQLVLNGAFGVFPLVLVAVSIHYANEYTDHETDRLTDRTPFSGGSGALERTGVSRKILSIGAVSALGLAFLSAVGMHFTLGLPTDALILLSLIAIGGLAYSLPPVAFIRRGLGEVVNAILGGILLPLYGVAIVHTPTADAALATVPFTLVIVCNLLATHWPDRTADAVVGKRTLAVRWSPRDLRTAYATLSVLAIALTLVLTGRVLPIPVAAAHLPAPPFLVWGGIVLSRRRSPFPAVAAMVILAASTTIGWWWIAFS